MSHITQLPNFTASAWMIHGRSVGIHNKWVATASVFSKGFGISIAKNLYGVQDDYGNFVEVPHEFN